MTLKLYDCIFRNLRCILLLCSMFYFVDANAQLVRVIDNKGTIQNINNNSVTTAATAPTSPTPVEGDVWFDISNDLTMIYDGVSWLDIRSTYTKKMVFSAEYENAVLEPDGTNNIGNMTADNAGSTHSWMNHYTWSNSQISGVANDYDIILRFTVPDDFVAWDAANAIVIDYAGHTNASVLVDVYLESNTTALATTGTLTGPGVNTWTTNAITNIGLTTLNEGKTGVLVIKLTAASVAIEGNSQMKIGDITFNYIGK